MEEGAGRICDKHFLCKDGQRNRTNITKSQTHCVILLNSNSRIASFVARLLEKSPNSTLGKLSGGAVRWKAGDAAGARDALRAVIADNSNPNFYGAYVLCFCHADLGEHAECEAMVAVASGLLEAKVKLHYKFTKTSHVRLQLATSNV